MVQIIELPSRETVSAWDASAELLVIDYRAREARVATDNTWRSVGR